MKNSRCRGDAGKARALFVLLAGAAALAASCGGPYAPKRVNVAGDKIALADQLFAKGSYGRAAVEYKDFLATFAGDDRSDYAQFRLGESYRLDGEYALAQVEYQILMNEYGYSEWVDDAFFLEGLCSFKQAPRPERDQTKSYEALDRLNRFIQTFPTSPRIAEARATLREVHLKLQEKDFLTAKLYFARKHHDAALVYLNKIVDLDSETPWAARSRYYRGRIEETRSNRTAAMEDYRNAVSAAGAFPEKGDAGRRLKLMEALTGGAPKPNGR